MYWKRTNINKKRPGLADILENYKTDHLKAMLRVESLLGLLPAWFCLADAAAVYWSEDLGFVKRKHCRRMMRRCCLLLFLYINSTKIWNIKINEINCKNWRSAHCVNEVGILKNIFILRNFFSFELIERRFSCDVTAMTFNCDVTAATL